MLSYIKVKRSILAFLPLVLVVALSPAAANAQSVVSVRSNDGLMEAQRSCDIFEESGGLIVMETESDNPAGSWTLQNNISGALGTGYYEWKSGNSSGGIDGSGQGILSYSVEINQTGTYRFLFRTAAPHTTEHNDAWIRFPDNDLEAKKANGNSNADLTRNVWFKVYQNKGGDAWNFDAHTVDNNAHQIFAIIDTPGVYRVEMSGRSTMFKVDRFVLFHENVSQSTATNTGTPESGCSSLPVELTSFAGLVDGEEVVLDWTTASELNNAGFDIEFAREAGGDFSKIGFVSGSGTSNESLDYTFAHTPGGLSGQTVYYRLKQLDFDGTFEYSDVVAVNLSLAPVAVLHPAYPNPFNPSATISFALPVESEVQLSVYDASGRLVQELINGVRSAGFHSEVFQATDEMASGMYMYRLVTPAKTLSGTVMLLK
ncbi:MAG: T9SS type A sorting domain-containing protein [Rhodothermales bacterium]